MHRHSLRRQLLAWVLFPLATAVVVDTWLTYQSAAETAATVQDRLLLGSARMIAEAISFSDGSFQHQIPPAALELFQSQESDRIFYRVTTGAGQLLAGYTDLPEPINPVAEHSPYFFETKMRGMGVRIVAFLQPVIGNPSSVPVMVEVAQTAHTRDRLTHKLWRESVGQQLLILLLVSVFILFGLRRGLRPLIRLRDAVRSRKEGSLQPLEAGPIPTELEPLVGSFNDYLQRLEGYTAQRSMFVQNAAHQLRTPLTVLHTQISDALRSSDARTLETSLLAARTTLQQTTRLVNQFLLLSSAEAALVHLESMSTQAFCAVIQKVLEDLSFQAHAKQLDLGFERSGVDAMITVDAAALREIATNLVDNAIRYTPVAGRVTARVESAADRIALVIEDNGMGVPAASREKIFERFYREGATDATGSGLGLAIVKELTLQCGGTVGVRPSQGVGFAIEVVFFG